MTRVEKGRCGESMAGWQCLERREDLEGVDVDARLVFWHWSDEGCEIGIVADCLL